MPNRNPPWLMLNRNIRNDGARMSNGRPSGARSQRHPIANRRVGASLRVSSRASKRSAMHHLQASGCEADVHKRVAKVPVVSANYCGLPHLNQVVRMEESAFTQ